MRFTHPIRSFFACVALLSFVSMTISCGVDEPARSQLSAAGQEISAEPATTTVKHDGQNEIVHNSTPDYREAYEFIGAWYQAELATSTTTTLPPTTSAPKPSPPPRQTPATTQPVPVAPIHQEEAEPTQESDDQTSSEPPASGLPAFLLCVRFRESRDNYQAYNRSSGASGAFQFLSGTARATANHAGRPDLASLPVLSWSPADQDAMAIHLYQWQGRSPWASTAAPC